MAGIYHQVGIACDVEQAYQALTTVDGISKWWSSSTGSAAEGQNYKITFGQMTFGLDVTRTTDNELVVWRPDDEAGREWRGTKIEFQLTHDGTQTIVSFAHDDWREVTPHMRHCSTKWAVFLLSLKQYLETGTGRPFPDDIQINHN